MSRLAGRQWREVAGFELYYQLRRASTWIFFAALLFPLFGQVNGEVLSARAKEIAFHAPIIFAHAVVPLSLLWLLLVAAVAGDAAARDVQLRVEPLMRTSPVRRSAYLGGRFLGAFGVVALLLLVVPVAFLLAPYVHSGLAPETAGTLRVGAYLQAYALLLVPNAFIAMALGVSFATITRHAMGAYAGAALVVAGTIFCRGFLAGALEQWPLAAVLDPSGLTTVALMQQSWSPAELEARLIGTDALLLWNRLLWLGIALAALVVAWLRSASRGYASGTLRRRFGRRAAAAPDDADVVPARGGDLLAGGRHGAAATASATARDRHAVLQAQRVFGAWGRLRQLRAVVRDAVREMLTPWSWLVVLVLAAQVLLTNTLLGVGGAPVLATTGEVLDSFGGQLNAVLVLVVLFAGELAWRERDANLHALADTAPVPDWIRFVGKLLALWLGVLVLHALVLLAGVLLQLRLGDEPVDLLVYLQVLFGLELVEPLVFALLALSVHVLVDHKHVGHLAVLLLVLAMNTVAGQFGIQHPMLIFGATPGWRYSEISGFEPFVGPALWFEAYWASWTVLIAVVASLFLVRGAEEGAGSRLRIARQRFRGGTAVAFAAALALLLAVGGFVFYNTNVLHPYLGAGQLAERSAEYERRYARHLLEPQPRMRATELHVELHPARGEADVRGTHALENRSDQPIATVHVALPPKGEIADIAFDRPARATVLDDAHGHRSYALDPPLAPGESLEMAWTSRYAPQGFSTRGRFADVVGNGSFIVMMEWMPLVGYQPQRELADADARREHGLRERPMLPPPDDPEARYSRVGKERVDLEVTIGTAAEQVAVAPGVLQASWLQDGRRYFRYATREPIGLGFALFSAEYAVASSRVGDVALEVVHHPAHDTNVATMLRSMEASLAQFNQRFRPYPYGALRMVEYPAEGGSLHAAAAMVWYKERFSLTDPARDERGFDLPFAVTAHEVAHQWWGGQPAARAEGIALLGESLAWYSALGVVEQEKGTEHLQRLLDFMRDAYLRPRPRADVPLLRASDWFLAYRKGPFAMHALREYVGQEPVDRALRRLLAQHASMEPPFMTSLDLYRELKAVTPEPLHGLLRDLFERTTYWELQAREATARPAPDGAWEVSLEVEARKVVVDEEGVETGVDMDDPVEIGVYAAAEPGQSRGPPLYLAMHHIRSGRQTITVTVPHVPARAGIDPRHLLIDTITEDNLADITRPAQHAGPDPATRP